MHEEILAEATKELLDKIEIPKDFYLAGGTALALQIGHRQSVDLDFFTIEDFSPLELQANLQEKHKLEAVQIIGDHTLIGICDGVKISFMKYSYPLLDELIEYKRTSLASVKDICTMKMSAISQRNAKKDFVDLYIVCKTQNTNLEMILAETEKRFPSINIMHILYSLKYFDEADKQPDVMWQKGFEVDWNRIKAYFENFVDEKSSFIS